jgi:hypothetical protein
MPCMENGNQKLVALSLLRAVSRHLLVGAKGTRGGVGVDPHIGSPKHRGGDLEGREGDREVHGQPKYRGGLDCRDTRSKRSGRGGGGSVDECSTAQQPSIGKCGIPSCTHIFNARETHLREPKAACTGHTPFPSRQSLPREPPLRNRSGANCSK